MAIATPVHAQEAAASTGATVLPNIKWSLSGEAAVRAPAQRQEQAPASAPPAQPRKGAAKRPAATKAARARPMLASVARKAVAAGPIVRSVPKAKPASSPAARRTEARAMKPVTARAPTRPIAAPSPVMPKPAPAIAPSSIVDEDSDPALVTTQPLTPRRVTEDEGSFGHAITAVASHTKGIPPLRPTVGILSLATALLVFAAIWWQSVGARMWGIRRRKGQPRLMIDVPLADAPDVGKLATRDIAFDQQDGWGDPVSSRLGDQAAAE
jgi:hypothetical protein